MTIGLGIVTHARPEFFGRLVNSICHNLDGVDIDVLAVHGYPGPGGGYGPATDQLRGWAHAEGIEWHLEATPVPRTVGHGKNVLLHLLSDCDWVFLAEDDMELISNEAVDGYITAALDSGVGHLSFHGHGPLNPANTGRHMGAVTSWPNSVGAWGLYSRAALDAVGHFDEGFHNAWEHVEHTLRMSLAGFGGSHGRYLDASGSERWLREQEGSIESSTIRSDPEWERNVNDGRRYWATAHPDSFRLIWPN